MRRLTTIDLAATCILAVAIAASGCVGEAGTHIGNPPVRNQLGLALQVTAGGDPAAPLEFADAQSTSYALRSAQAYVRHIRLDLPQGVTCADVEDDLVGARCELSEGEPRISVDGPLVIDLVTATSTPSLDEVRIPALDYRRIDFRLDDGEPDDGLISPGSPLDDRSLVASADFTYQGTPSELRLELEFNEDVRIENLATFSPTTGGDLLLLLDVTEWLAGLPLTSCIDDGDLEFDDGVLVIDDDAGDDDCDDLDDFIKDNIKRATRAESDDD